ncbi:MAG: hypothetical protein KKE02_13760 [Alphaproteobacteria bacterium]|nr:hypothetical protein [Alphaproteobacteria bacterium]MBU1516163.1 hypothetical protein [Alphaproteobacteria bacterium]MBU2097112.1 hypothetical protein [Alphaproteobacteria bacterium]MBU2152080.1 hypothetical protein [Alphaproteobacteria bacterium]MBU2309681.1 hypothetical protein [Alphaproteobacteria bacterium]
MSPDELRDLFAYIAPDLDLMAAPWSLIGSGALILLGAPVDEAADLDIVTGADGAGRLRAAWADWLAPGEAKPPDGPFRSDDFARYETPLGPVEVMGGLRVRGRLLDVTGPIPSGNEQLRILRLFGRPKDLAKAATLEAWLAAG